MSFSKEMQKLIDSIPGFDIVCKQCGNKITVKDSRDYSEDDNIEVFANCTGCVTILCAKCLDNGFDECNQVGLIQS